MTVLRGAVSQWKRSEAVSEACGPAAAPPSQMRSIDSRCERMVATSVSGASAAGSA